MADPVKRRPTTPRPPRVLLVDPYIARLDPMERKFVELYPSLGLLQLGAYLRDERVEVQFADLTFERDVTGLRRRIRSFAPDLVGVHTKSLTMLRALRIASLARAAGAVSVAGGPDAASRPDAYLAGGYDLVAFGEGEATLLDLARCVVRDEPIAGRPGTIVTGTGGPIRGPARPFLRDLDELPLPAWDLVDMSRYLAHWHRRTGERRAAVLTSRGCPFDCSWCSKPTFGRSFRQQSPDRVLRELRALQNLYDVDYVRFCDDVFGIHRAWIEELLDRMIDQRLGIQFECLARVDLLKPDLLKRMREAGLARVYVGVESGSQKMLDLMNRGTRLEQIERAATALRREGIRQFWFLMLGYPGESLEDIESTLALFRRFSPEEYSVSLAVPLPGTRFFELVRDRLRSVPKPAARSGGRRLLYEAPYPQAFYRWQQARFELEAILAKARGRISNELLGEIAELADRIDRGIARPLLARPRSSTPPPHGAGSVRFRLPSIPLPRRPFRPAR